MDDDLTLLSSQIVDLIWFVFATSPFFLGYYAIHQPEIFKISQKHNVMDSESEIDLNTPIQRENNYIQDPRYFRSYVDVQKFGFKHDFCRLVIPEKLDTELKASSLH